MLKQSVYLLISCASLMYLFLYYWHCWLYCIVFGCWFGVGCLSFKVHCFTFARFIYRLLPVTGPSRLVTLNGWTVDALVHLSWAFYENVYGFYGLNLNQLRFNMIRLNYIQTHKNTSTSLDFVDNTNAIWFKTLVPLLFVSRRREVTHSEKCHNIESNPGESSAVERLLQ